MTCVLVNQMNSSYISVDDLKPDTNYMARFWTLINNTANYITDTSINRTLDLKTLNSSLDLLDLDFNVQDTVYAIQISNFDVSDGSQLKASLTWMPSKGIYSACVYKK